MVPFSLHCWNVKLFEIHIACTLAECKTNGEMIDLPKMIQKVICRPESASVLSVKLGD